MVHNRRVNNERIGNIGINAQGTDTCLFHDVAWNIIPQVNTLSPDERAIIVLQGRVVATLGLRVWLRESIGRMVRRPIIQIRLVVPAQVEELPSVGAGVG